MDGVDYFVKFSHKFDLPLLPIELLLYIRHLTFNIPVKLNFVICDCIKPSRCICGPTYSLYLEALKD